jgi:hypothetical protein
MRNRHRPRLCGSCAEPMAVQEDTCWSCDARWGADEAPSPSLVLLPLDTDRWMTDGGHFDDAAALVAAGS